MSSTNEFDTSLMFTPEGVRDVFGDECARREVIRKMIENEMSLYGFRGIITPSYEFFDIFNKERGTIPSNQMFKFFDSHNNTLVLRPDHTPQIARCVARYYGDEQMQLRLRYTGNTYIHRTGYQGKMAETTQIGAEIIGDSSSDADGEMLTLAIDCLKKSGLKEFKIDVGHAGIFRGLVKEAGLDSEEAAKLRTYIENKNSHAVEELLKDKDLDAGIREVLIKMPEIFADPDSLTFVKSRVHDAGTLDAIDRLIKISEIIEGFGMTDYVTLDLGMLAKMDYYTGVIFKAYTYGTGEAIVSGGRYDNLMKQFGNDKPAVGVVFLLEPLMEALESEKVDVPIKKNDILILYRSANRSTAIDMAQSLRDDGVPVFLMRKNADTPLDEYKKYGVKAGLKEIRYIDDTGEVCIFELTGGAQ